MNKKEILKEENLEEILGEIAEENNFTITPKIVVEKAKPKNSSLHKFFDWDDTTAAEKFRLHQAQDLIKRCKITIEEPNKEPVVTRAFVSLSTDRSSEQRCYRTLSSILNNNELRQQMIEDAKKEMLSFKKKYSLILKVSDIEKIDSLFDNY